MNFISDQRRGAQVWAIKRGCRTRDVCGDGSIVRPDVNLHVKARGTKDTRARAHARVGLKQEIRQRWWTVRGQRPGSDVALQFHRMLPLGKVGKVVPGTLFFLTTIVNL